MIERPDPVLPTLPMSADLSDVHYSFDYAQAVSVPHHICQVGPLYFATHRKVQLFGVALEGIFIKCAQVFVMNQII